MEATGLAEGARCEPRGTLLASLSVSRRCLLIFSRREFGGLWQHCFYYHACRELLLGFRSPHRPQTCRQVLSFFEDFRLAVFLPCGWMSEKAWHFGSNCGRGCCYATQSPARLHGGPPCRYCRLLQIIPSYSCGCRLLVLLEPDWNFEELAERHVFVLLFAFWRGNGQAVATSLWTSGLPSSPTARACHFPGPGVPGHG